MDFAFQELPCKIDDVISYNISFENLHKLLNFLVSNDKDYYTKINDIRLKMSQLEDVKSSLEEVTLRLTNCESKFSGIINSFIQKFNELDCKISGATNVNKIFQRRNIKNKIFSKYIFIIYKIMKL